MVSRVASNDEKHHNKNKLVNLVSYFRSSKYCFSHGFYNKTQDLKCLVILVLTVLFFNSCSLRRKQYYILSVTNHTCILAMTAVV